jgi:hypothetical protein
MDIKNYPEIIKADKELYKIHGKWDKLTFPLQKVKRDTPRHKKLLLKSEAFYNKVKTFNKTVYAKVVFDIFSKENPMLIERRTRERHTWIEIFGTDFEETTESMRINMKGMLTDAYFPYKFEEATQGLLDYQKTPEGEVELCNEGWEMPIWRNGKVVDYGRNNGKPIIGDESV